MPQTSGYKQQAGTRSSRPFEFAIGRGRVIPGWNEAVASIKFGGKRTSAPDDNLQYWVRANFLWSKDPLLFGRARVEV